jgi:5-methylcytosine-specific restriction endonuclease McrA
MGRKKDIQLTLESFAGDAELPCRGDPARNACRVLCVRCVHAGKGTALFCAMYGRTITFWNKYGLREWKHLRKKILVRDGGSCAICSSPQYLHIHHYNGDKTDDSPENLLTLCDICHSRVHRELMKAGGQERVKRVLFSAVANRIPKLQEMGPGT